MQASWGAPHLPFPPNPSPSDPFKYYKCLAWSDANPPKKTCGKYTPIQSESPKRRANPPGIPSESPCESPMPHRHLQTRVKASDSKGVPSELPLRVPLPHRHYQTKVCMRGEEWLIMWCHHCCIHVCFCFWGADTLLSHSLGQPVPASLMH